MGSCSSAMSMPGSDGVRHASRNVDDVARAHRHHVQRPQKPLGVLLGDPRHVRLLVRPARAADPDLRVVPPRVEHEPGLGLPEWGAELVAGERAVRVEVDGKPLRAVEELHQEACRPAEALDMGCPEPARRVLVDRVAQQAPVREPGQALLGVVAAGVPRRGHRADPVLGVVAVTFRIASEPIDQRAAAVEAVDAVRSHSLCAHARSLAKFRSTMGVP